MKLNNLEKIFKASQETLNKFLITQLPINIFLVNADGYVCWANQNLLNYVNINSLKDVIGMHISQWDKCRWDAIQEILKTKQETITEEFYNETFFSTIRKPVIQNGELIGVLGLSIDITEKKQSEIAKQEFIMNMAHDLRTPLAGIIGLASIQADSKMELQEQQQYGAWIHGASEQLLELLNSVIEVTATEHQTEQAKKERIDLSQLSDELQTLMQPSLQSKGLQFQIKRDKNLPAIISDHIKLKRLLLNMLSNAIKFTPQGKIGLEITLLAIEGNQAKIEVQISDTGIGIAKDKLDKIFDRFYRAYPSYQGEYKGYGIGLYLVKKTVELLRGEIKVSSEEGKGSCFTLYFNFLIADQNPNKNKTALQEFESAAHSEPGKRKGMVLVAEDNDLVLHAVKNILAGLDYGVVTVTKGKAALEALQTQSFVWALLDIGLPDLSGTEVAQAYRQWEQANNKPRPPLFALTAHSVEEAEEKYKEIGIDYIFNKPFTCEDVQIIEQIIC